MKRVITIAVCLLTVISSCTKKNTTTNPPQQNQNPATVNSTEQQLVGTWFQDKTETHWDDTLLAHLDTTIIGYDQTCYVQFTTDRFDPDNWSEQYKLGRDAISRNGSLTMGNSSPCYWYYDPATSLLNMYTGTYTIVTLTTNQLVLKNRPTSNSYTTLYYFHK